jgi:nitrate reductase NapD
MHYSGVAVVVRPDRFGDACRAIDALPGVEVHLRHPDGRRLIAVVESEGVSGQQERLARIRDVPGVLVAAPAFHYVDNDAGDGSDSGGDGPATSKDEGDS